MPTQAEAYISEARKKASACFFPDKTGASFLLEKAGNIYESVKNYDTAAALFEEAHLYESSSLRQEYLREKTFNALVKAKAAVQAWELLEVLVSTNIERGCIWKAAAFIETLADVLPCSCPEAAILYRRAADLLHPVSRVAALSCLRKLAQSTMDPAVFEEMARVKSENSVVTTEYIHAFFCRALRDGVGTALAALDKYTDKEPMLASCVGSQIARNMVTAPTKDEFDDQAAGFFAASPWESGIIQKIRAALFP